MSLSPPTLYSPGGKLVFCNMDSRKSGGCVPPNASLSWLIKILWDSILLLFTAPFPAEQCACLSVYLYGSVAEGAVGVQVSDRVLLGCHGGRPMAGRLLRR